MAAKKEETCTGREEIYVPRGRPGDEESLFVSVNGKNYLVPKGKKSLVPTEVAEEIRRSWEAQDLAEERMMQMQEANK